MWVVGGLGGQTCRSGELDARPTKAKGSRKSLMKVGALREGARVWKEHGSLNLKTALTADNVDEYQELTMALISRLLIADAADAILDDIHS